MSKVAKTTKAVEGELIKNKVGRPSKLTPETIQKLYEAFAIGASDGEACLYAETSTSALYEYQKKHPEFLDRKKTLKQNPVLMARQTVMNNLKNNVQVAQWYLERKMKNEFSTKVENDTTIQVVTPILGGAAKQVEAGNTDVR